MQICRVCALRTEGADVRPPLRDFITDLLSNLNACPAIELPRWTLNPTQSIARVAQHGSPLLWDDGGNIAGSVLMLILLRPLVFGMPWLPPLRIFGVPPPTALLHLDDTAIGRRPPHDNHRTNIVEGLLGWFQSQGDTLRGNLLQDAWLLVKSTIAQQDLGGLPSWHIARRILNATQDVIAPSIAQGSQPGGSRAAEQWLTSEEEELVDIVEEASRRRRG